MVQQFDALAFELERDAKFQQTHSPQLEISNAYNYSEGINYFYVHVGDLEIGQYYKDPWGACWYWKSSITGDQAHCPNKAIALSNIQRIWMGWCR